MTNANIAGAGLRALEPHVHVVEPHVQARNRTSPALNRTSAPWESEPDRNHPKSISVNVSRKTFLLLVRFVRFSRFSAVQRQTKVGFR